MDIYETLKAQYETEEKFQWTDENNQLHWLTSEELASKNG